MLAPPRATAQRLETTGSRLGSTITGRVVTQIGTPHEIGDIRNLLERGQTEEALRLASDFLESLETVSYTGASGSPIRERYIALNAYCIALTRSGQLDDALSACDEAIALQPDRWTGLNNRGIVNLTAGRYEPALADFREALRSAPDSGVATLIEQNIALTMQRQAEVAAQD